MYSEGEIEEQSQDRACDLLRYSPLKQWNSIPPLLNNGVYSDEADEIFSLDSQSSLNIYETKLVKDY